MEVAEGEIESWCKRRFSEEYFVALVGRFSTSCARGVSRGLKW